MAKLVQVREVWPLAIDGDSPLPYLRQEVLGWKGVRSVELADNELTIQGSVIPTWCIVLAVVLFPLGLFFLLNRQDWLCSIESDGAEVPQAVVRGWLPEPRATELQRLRLVVEPVEDVTITRG